MSRKGKRSGKGKKETKPRKDESAPPENETTDTPEGASADQPDETLADAPAEDVKLDPLEEQVQDLTDRLQRKTAEFANYQKRIQKEMDETRKYAIKPLALDLLQVLDSFERALDSSAEESAERPQVEDEFAKGFKMIYGLLKGALTSHGIVLIEAKDRPFDPNSHDAVMEEENPDLPDRTVIDELVKGYMLHERLLRPSRVRVSRTPKEPSTEEKAADEKLSEDADEKLSEDADEGQSEDKD